MKKLTASVARKLSAKSLGSKITTFQGAIDIILVEAQLGKKNCFIDGDPAHLYVVMKELKERGFKVYLDIVDSAHYLSVEW